MSKIEAVRDEAFGRRFEATRLELAAIRDELRRAAEETEALVANW